MDTEWTDQPSQVLPPLSQGDGQPFCHAGDKG